jgi:hypothetical protein
MKIVYCHNRIILPAVPFYDQPEEIHSRGGSTVAMEVVQSWLLDNLTQGDAIVRKVGIARCSLDDNYDKSKGRELALSRLKSTELTVVNIVKMGVQTTVFLEDANDNLFELKKSKDKDCAILVRMLEE